jgi:hypothetical protein
MSAQLKRDKGRPRTAGISQARALICTTSSGGKDPGAARARALFEPGKSFMKEALAPQAHDIAPYRERSGDLLIGATLGGEQDHLAGDFEIWQRILTRPVFQHHPLVPGEPDREGTTPWHVGRSSFDEG